MDEADGQLASHIETLIDKLVSKAKSTRKDEKMFKLNDGNDIDDRETRDEMISEAYRKAGPFVPKSPSEKIEIDPRITQADIKFLAMSPDERYRHLMAQGHAFPTRAQCTDESVIKWFNKLGPIGQERLRLATQPIALTAPPSTPFGDLVYWHRRATELAPGRDIIVTTARK
jgi:hypothetical protein